MNHPGELEIAINKRTIERAAFALVIVVLGVLLAIKWNGGESADSQAQLLKFEQDLNESSAQIQSLQLKLTEANAEIAVLEDQASEPKQSVAPVPTTSAAACDGDITYDWNADAEIQTPDIYNKVKIDNLTAEIEALEDELDDNETSQARKGVIPDEIDDLESEIDDLTSGSTKLKLKNITISIDNQVDEDAELSYLVCWSSFDCTKVKTEAIIKVDACDSLTHTVDIKIPTFLDLDNKAQVLQLVITKDDVKVYEDTYTFRQ